MKTTLPGKSAGSNPLAGKDLDAITRLAETAPVTLGTTAAEVAGDGNAQPRVATKAPVAHQPDVGATKETKEKKGVLATQRVPMSLLNALRYLKEAEDRSEAWLITQYAGPAIKARAKELGWQEEE